MVQTTHFRIGFDGSALQNHEMPVGQFAPALLALSNLLEEAAHQCSQGEGKATISVRGNVKSGSIEVDLTILTRLIDNITNFLSGNSVTAVLNGIEVLSLLGLAGGGGLIALIIKLSGKAPEKVSENDDHTVTIFVENNTFIEDKRVVQLYQNLTIRNNLYQMLQPLESEGVESFRAGEKILHTLVKKEEVMYFSPPTVDDTLVLENETQKAFGIVALSFKEDNKWRLHDGQNTISAEIKDEAFVNQVNNNEAFRKNDILICKLRTRQWQTDQGIRSEYTILKVMEHRPSHRQVPLSGMH